MLNKTYLLTGSRDPGFRPWVPTIRTAHHSEAFWCSRERGKKASPCRTQKNKPSRQFKRRPQPC
ncbi:MAG: hypothetical protein KBD36_03380 [Alphaproteobacteria bacterium]|nr:hypothetical protein [Alphaproteobacteria bacterium]